METQKVTVIHCKGYQEVKDTITLENQKAIRLPRWLLKARHGETIIWFKTQRHNMRCHQRLFSACTKVPCIILKKKGNRLNRKE